MDNPTYQIKVRYAVECVKHLLPQVDAATSLVLVGDLSQCRSGKLEGVMREPISVENPVFSESYGRLTIPLSGLNKYALKKELLPHIGLRQRITEVQLERYGRFVFSSFISKNYQRCDALWKCVASEREDYATIYNLNQPHGGHSHRKY
jgi:hypothetical protein